MEMGARVQQLQIAHWLTSPFGSSLAGANYNQFVPAIQEFPWSSFYPSSVVTTVDIINQTKDDATRTNLYNAARIWKAYTFMILTDTYGDVPYTEAGKGYLEQIIKPVYDTQEAIYTDILKELDEASAALDPAKSKISGEILYGRRCYQVETFWLFTAAESCNETLQGRSHKSSDLCCKGSGRRNDAVEC